MSSTPVVQVKTMLSSHDSCDAITSVLACQGLPGPLLPQHARVHFLRAGAALGVALQGPPPFLWCSRFPARLST